MERHTGASRNSWLRIGGTALAAAMLATGCSASGPRSGGSTGGTGEAAGRQAPAHTLAPGPNGAAPKGSVGGAVRPTAPPLPPSPDPTIEDVPRPSGLVDPERDRFSTFALDVDTGSYTRFRDATRRRHTLPPDQIRTEEFVNYFAQDYEAPAQGVDVRIDAARLPFDPSRRIVRVGIRSADAAAGRKQANIVLVVDCSGSMASEGKMELTKSALTTMARALEPGDTVTIVGYDSQARTVLEPTSAQDSARIVGAIQELAPGSSTNAEAGLALGYDHAQRLAEADPRAMTRVVLVSDGVANVGETDPDGILARIGTWSRKGVHLVSVGVGMSDYNDRLLEQLADRGDGWHAYVDTEAEAAKVFAEDLTGTLVITARNAKAQVEFDPDQVEGYRLIGYENRAIGDEQFRDDGVDGGEVRAGHASTALYEVVLREGRVHGDRAFVAGTVRYEDESGKRLERRSELRADAASLELGKAAPRLQQDVVVAMLTDHLTGGPWSERVSLPDISALAEQVGRRLGEDRDVTELVELVRSVQA